MRTLLLGMTMLLIGLHTLTLQMTIQGYAYHAAHLSKAVSRSVRIAAGEEGSEEAMQEKLMLLLDTMLPEAKTLEVDFLETDAARGTLSVRVKQSWRAPTGRIVTFSCSRRVEGSAASLEPDQRREKNA